MGVSLQNILMEIGDFKSIKMFIYESVLNTEENHLYSKIEAWCWVPCHIGLSSLIFVGISGKMVAFKIWLIPFTESQV